MSSGTISKRRATIQAKRRVAKKTVVTAVSSVTVNSVKSALSSLKDPRGPLLTPEQVSMLLELELFTLETPGFTMQVAGQISQFGFSAVYEAIKDAEDQKEAFFLMPAMGVPLAKVVAYDERFLTESEVVSGVFVCPNKMCKSDQIMSAQSQVSRTDEPMTTFLCCTKCGTRWTRR